MRPLIYAASLAVLLVAVQAQAARNDPGNKAWHTGEVETTPVVPDPIYAAFDEGRYMEAKKLAEEAAAKGDGPAHTMLGIFMTRGWGFRRILSKPRNGTPRAPRWATCTPNSPSA